jgi:hypothetical protein
MIADSFSEGVVKIVHGILPVDSASNRNEYKEYLLTVKAAGA